MISPRISAKYAKLFSEADGIRKFIGGKAGTRPIDISAFYQFLQTRFANPAIMEGLVRDYMKAADINLKK